MAEKMIGVIAGVGPFAGADLFQKILAETVAGKDQDHLPVLSLSQPSAIVDRTEYLLGQVAVNPGVAMGRQLRTLAAAGAEVIGVPCNTAHAPEIFGLLEAEAAACGVRLLHMIGETGRFLREERPFVRHLGILSTTGTYLACIYPNVLEPLGFTTHVPPRAFQEAVVHPAIYDPNYGIKARGSATAQARNNVEQGMRLLQQQGAEAIVLGCTELPLAVETAVWESMLLVDPTRILARALIREANPAKLKPLH